MKKGFFCLIFLSLFLTGSAQKKIDFRFWEDSLIRLRDAVMTTRGETERMILNEDFMNLLESILHEPNSFNHKWDSVKNFSVLTSPDRLFKLFTWFVEKDNFTVENYGFLQLYNDNRKKYVIYPLYDQRQTIENPHYLIADHNQWYGAVYYDIILLETKEKKYYTLLGWNGNDLFTNQKLIEVLHFKKDYTPQFGARIFKKYPDKIARAIFEYNKNSSFSLKYEKQSYMVRTGKKDPKTKRVLYQLVTQDMIVFDQLIKMEEEMEHIPAFTVPESSLNWGFIPADGRWLFLDKVEARGPNIESKPYHPKTRTYYTPNN